MRKEVIKHSAAIQIANKLTLLQRRLYNILLANAYAELPYADTHNADVNDICETLCYDSKNIKHLKTSLKGLMTTVVEWNLLRKDGGEDWKASTLLADAGLTNGVFTYSYSPFLKAKLYNPEIYAKISLSLQNDFRSSHSLAVYELLLDYYDHKKAISRTPYITIEKFRQLLGLAPGTYKDFKALKRDIISKSIKEINDISDLHAEVTFKRVGRSIGKLQFTIKRNEKNSFQAKPIPIPKQGNLPLPGLDIENQDLLMTLVENYGVGVKVATQLLESYDEFQIQDNLKVVESSIKSGKVSKNLAGFVVTAIKNNYQPTTTKTKEQEVLNKNRKLAQALQKEEEQKKSDKRAKDISQLIEGFSQLPSDQQNQILSDFEKSLPPVMSKMFIEDNRDITNVKYSGTFFDYMQKD